MLDEVIGQNQFQSFHFIVFCAGLKQLCSTW